MNFRGLIFFTIAGALLGVAIFASASSKDDIVFPVAELGNCADEAACRQYCGDFSHAEECFAFAKKHNLTKGQELRERAVKELKKGGPGDCASENECRQYCGDPAHGEECLRFAEENGFMTKDELARARKFLRVEGPGGCRAEQCRDYCADSAHQKECFEFAKKNGLIGEKEARIAEKVLKSGGPGGCKGERECRAYCDDPAHLEECVAFAEEHDLISKEDALVAKKIAGKPGPGGCRGDACRVFCENPDHMEQCIAFAEKNGLMSPEELARAKKMIGKIGPGGCRARACETYCKDPAHSEECIQFAIDNELLPPEEASRAKKFMQVAREAGPGGCRAEQCRDYCADSAHQEECFEFAKKNGLVSEEDLRGFDAVRKLDAVVAEKGGPGGCKSENECRNYCHDQGHVEECIAFASAHGGIAADQARRMLEEFVRGMQEFRAPMQQGGFPRDGGFIPGEFGSGEFGSLEDRLRRFEEFRKLEGQFRGGGVGSSSGLMIPQGGFGGPGGGSGFFGPGGCSSPDVCIKYCFEHRGECVNFGLPGVPATRLPEGGIPPGILNPPKDYRSPRELQQFSQPPQSGAGSFPGSAGGFHPEDANIKGPGGCIGLECAQYCSDPAHRLECAVFFAPSSVQPMSPPPSGGSVAPYPSGGTGTPYPSAVFPQPEGDFPPPGELFPEPILDDFDENGEPRGALEGDFFGVMLAPFLRIFR